METKQRSSQKFCRCGHARSLTYVGLSSGRRYPNLCGVLACECVRHDTAKSPRSSKYCKWCRYPTVACKCASSPVVEVSPNAMARDAAVKLLQSALNSTHLYQADEQIKAAIVCLEVIS